jgi:sterol 3beta-glucosyltransferase
MRAGTQTLIQALQALPLVDDPEIDEELMSPGESDSDDEGKHGEPLAHFHTRRNL